MQKQVPLTEIQKDSFGIIYYCAKNALETCEALREDKTLDGYIRYNFIRVWETAIGKVKKDLDKALGCNERFNSQVKDTDTLGLHEVVTQYLRLSPDGRESFEKILKALNESEDVSIEVLDHKKEAA